ncbi:MAG: undecaprenyl-diphosphate phosphatase, partial [Candidatus Zixiibacteriota bacterium]
MSYFEAATLGIIQGLTEYLPVSSSGHLVLAQELFGFNPKGIAFEIVVHLGSLLAVLVYFRQRLWRLFKSLYPNGERQERKYIQYLFLATIPAGIIGLAFEDFFDKMFSSPVMTSFLLFITGLILLSTRFAPRTTGEVSLAKSLVIGLAQASAILPGISRSGSTITAGLWAKVDPAKAAEFSFLLSIPAIGGAAILKSDELISQSALELAPFLISAVLSCMLYMAANPRRYSIK